MDVEPGLGHSTLRIAVSVPREGDQHHILAETLANSPGHLVTVEPGKPDVDENHIGGLCAGGGYPLRAIDRGHDMVALQLQREPQHLARVAIVLDDEHPARSREPPRLRDLDGLFHGPPSPPATGTAK